jgi:Zn-dependent peptidase ImmA (M78 family)
MGEHVDWVNEYIPTIEEYFHKPLSKNLFIYTTPTTAEYLRVLNFYKIPNAEYLAEHTYGLTSSGNVILINGHNITRTRFRLTLGHEMTHQYQIEIYGESILNDKKWIERDAEKHSYNILRLHRKKR